MRTTTLTTTLLTLTPLVEADADVMVDVLGDERMHEFTGGRPLTLDELRARYRLLVRGHSADGTERWFNWIVRTVGDGEAVGVVQATVAVDGSWAEVAWEIGVPWQGRGFASEAAAAMVTWLAGSGVAEIRACVHPEHLASAGVAAKVGLEPTTEVVDGEVVWRRPG